MLGGAQQRGDFAVGERPAGVGPGRAGHVANRAVVDDAFVIRPPDRSAQHPEPAADHAVGGPCRVPSGFGHPDLMWGERHDPGARERHVAGEEPCVGPVPDPGRRLPPVIRDEPPLEQLRHRQQRRGAGDRPSGGVLGGELAAVVLRVGGVAVEGHRALDGAARHRVGAGGDADLPDARAAFGQCPLSLDRCHHGNVGTDVGMEPIPTWPPRPPTGP